MSNEGGQSSQRDLVVDSSSFEVSTSSAVPKRRALNRALPGRIIDLIRDGVPPNELRTSGGRAVYRALWRTAASACQRGIDQWEWEEYLFQPRSELGRQIRLRDGRTQVPEDRVRKTLNTVWDQATAWVSEQEPPATRRELLLRSRPGLTAARAKLEDPGAALTDSDRLVLEFACDEIERRGLEKVTLPWRSVKEETKLGERSVKNSLERLEKGQYLLVVERGKPSGPSGRSRATVYRLPLPLPVNGSVGPPS